MCRTSAAEGKQNKLPRIIPSEIDFFPYGRCHIVVYDFSDEQCGLLHAQPEGIGKFGFDCLFSLLFVQEHPAAKIIIGIDISKDEVCIGHSGFFPPLIITDRPRVRTCAPGAHLQLVPQEFVYPCDRSSSGAYGHGLEHGDTHHPTIQNGTELIVSDTLTHHQTNVETRTAHITRYHVFISQFLRQPIRPDKPCHRACTIGSNRVRFEHFGHPPRIMHHHERTVVVVLAEFVPHGRKLHLHGAEEIGIQNSRHCPLIFTGSPDHVAG